MCIVDFAQAGAVKTGPAQAESAKPDSSTGLQAQDAPRALRNNPAPPERLRPLHTLPPLPASEEGIIRRVRIPDGRKVVALTCDNRSLDKNFGKDGTGR